MADKRVKKEERNEAPPLKQSTGINDSNKKRKRDLEAEEHSDYHTTTSTNTGKITNNNKSSINVTPKSYPVPTDRPVRVYADGIYDLFHFGHARSLEQAKKLFPNTYLLVGVCNDELTHRLKGKTVMTDKERAESVRHCRWVDEVVEDAPWIVTQEFLDEHKIDFVAHGEDIILDENGVDIYKFVKDQGRYQVIKRTDGISTSDLILRIVMHYDDYVRRNLKRGYTGKQMNVSFMKEKQIMMEDKLNDIKKKLKNSVETANKAMNKWSSEHHIVEFIKKFGGEVEKLVFPFKKRRRTSSGEMLSSSGEYSSDEGGDYYDSSDVEAK